MTATNVNICVGGGQVSIALIKCAGVKNLLNAFSCRHVPVITAFGTDVQAFFGFLSEDRCLTAGTPHPESCRHPPLSARCFVIGFFIVGFM